MFKDVENKVLSGEALKSIRAGLENGLGRLSARQKWK